MIVVLICLIAFLLWRLTQRARKQNSSVTVHAIHYDVHTKSILNPEGRAKNNGDSNHTRVHFEEPTNHKAAKCQTLEQAVNNTTGGTKNAAMNKVKSNCPISRRLAIRRKSSEELERKYPINKDGDSGENKTSCADKAVSNPSQVNLHIADYVESNVVTQSHGSTENPAAVDCSEDELSFLKTIP